LRRLTFTAPICPLPALELLIAEMFAIHFCSDRDESLRVLSGLLDEVRSRVAAGVGYGDETSPRIFWVNPVADMRAMNVLEECGARIGGTEYLFTHALDLIPVHIEPMDALARMALADPMVGSATDRADRICRDALTFGADAMVVSRIPGASHCAVEGAVIGEMVRTRLGIPVLEIEISPVIDSLLPGLRTRLEALVEITRCRRRSADPRPESVGATAC
jgi:hypothetical protein